MGGGDLCVCVCVLVCWCVCIGVYVDVLWDEVAAFGGLIQGGEG